MMVDRATPEQIKQRQAQNRYAREVIAGSDVQLSHRPLIPQQPVQQFRPLPAISLGKVGPVRAGYLLATVAIALASLAVYAFGGFEPASVTLFVLSLTLMAGWFVF